MKRIMTKCKSNVEVPLETVLDNSLFQEQRKAENEGVTEDDVNEIKNDISAFRFSKIISIVISEINTD